jgi:hypothetical protein
LIWHAFVDPRRAALNRSASAVLLAFATLLAIELTGYQVWLNYPPFRSRVTTVGGTTEIGGWVPERDAPRVRMARRPETTVAARTWSLTRNRVFAAVGQIGLWCLVGFAASRKPYNIGGVAAAVVGSIAILTAGRVARQVFTYAAGVDPGFFGFAALTESASGLLRHLGRLTIIETWSAVALAAGLSTAWSRPLHLVLPAIVGASAAWMMFPAVRSLLVNWLPVQFGF